MAEGCLSGRLMIFRINLNKILSRLALLAILLAACALLVHIIFQNFIVSSFSNPRYKFDRPSLARAVERFPDSPRLNHRLARAETSEIGGDLSKAERHAQAAIRLAPENFNYHLALASIQEARGDRTAAELSIREAVRLSPTDIEARWRLANILIRRGHLQQSLEEFRLALSQKKTLLPASLDLVWRVSGGDVSAVRSITNRDVESLLTLARFLLDNSQADEAAVTLDALDRDSLIASAGTSEFVSRLIQRGRIDLARRLWERVVEGDEKTIIYNGSFEHNPAKGFPQFDWNIARSDYARIEVDQATARTGARSLRISFAGRDTTRLDQEIKQTLALRALARYRLECYVRTADLLTPEGPRIVISDGATSALIARSEPVTEGTSDWRVMAVEFVAPKSQSNMIALQISIKRLPKYSYDDPTRGTLWLDDFTIREISSTASK